jgi:hypothetical protein
MTRTKLWLLIVALALLFPALALADTGIPEGTPAGELTDLTAWSSITGVLLPWVAALLLQAGWSSSVKSVAVAVFCGVDAIVVTGLTHGWHFDQHYIVSAAMVFALARTTYAGLWKQITAGADGAPVIKQVEAKTSV